MPKLMRRHVNRQVARQALKLAQFLRRCAGVVLRNLNQGLGHSDDEGIRLAVGLFVVIAKDFLERLRLDQGGERNNCFALLSRDGGRQA